MSLDTSILPSDLASRFEGLSHAKQVDLLNKAKAYVETLDYSGHHKWFIPNTPYSFDYLPKHKMFLDSGAKYSLRCLIAGNRVGKTQTALYEVVSHATGDYHQDWQGKRFDRPVNIWVAGTTAEKVKEILQAGLMGEGGAVGTGMLPLKSIVGKRAKAGVSGALSEILVRHKSGGTSTIGLKAYKEGGEGFYGVKKDFVLLDEEPPEFIFNEAYMRTINTGGQLVFTFTPLKGYTPLIIKLFHHADLLGGAIGLEGAEALYNDDPPPEKPYKCVVQISWDDVPWITPEVEEQQLRETPAHLRDARKKGIPAPGDGAVYPITTDRITYVPGSIEIPSTWPRIYGFDVGFNTSAAVWGAYDKANDIIYIYDEYVGKQNEPQYHAYNIKARGEWIPGEIDPASKQRNQIDGKTLFNLYKNYGLKLKAADNAVETGIGVVYSRLVLGKLKIATTCKQLLAELQLYSRKEEKIVKKNDHAADALRYLVMGIKHAQCQNQQISNDGNTVGYLKF